MTESAKSEESSVNTPALTNEYVMIEGAESDIRDYISGYLLSALPDLDSDQVTDRTTTIASMAQAFAETGARATGSPMDVSIVHAVIKYFYTKKDQVTIEKKVGYFIFGSTGCSCCKENNFITGMFDTEDQAIERAISYEQDRRVRSQYSATGLYYVRKAEYEQFSDDRVMLGDHLFKDGIVYEDGDIANHLRYVGEEIISAGKLDKDWQTR